MRRGIFSRCAGTRHLAAAAAVLTTSTRCIRTPGVDQYYPLHSFSDASFVSSPASQQQQQQPAATAATGGTAGAADVSFAEFKTMVTNPGPLRIVSSDDYLDWYYTVYKEKL